MLMKKLALGGASLCVLTFASAAFAQDQQTTEVDELLVVTKGLEQTLPLELSRQGHDLVIIDEATLRNKAYIDASSALQMETPGLYLAQQAGPFSYTFPSLQGSRPQDLLWTVDGVRLNNRLYSTTLPDTLPVAAVERIEVLKGGEGLFYGTQAVAGTINIVTRSFSDEFGGTASIGGDTNDGLHGDGYVRGAFGRHKYVAFASYDEGEGFETFTAFQQSSTMRRRSYEVATAGLKYGIDLTDDLSLSASAIHINAGLSYPSATRVAYSQNARLEDVVSIKLDYAPDEGLQFFVKGYHHDWDSSYTTITNSLTVPVTQTIVDQDTYWGYKDQGVNALAKLPVGGFDLLAGYDFQQYEARDDVLLIESVAEDVHGLFGQIRTNSDLSERYNIGLGVRYNKTGETDATVWNVTGRFDITDRVYLQGNAGSTFSLPTAENLFAIDPFSTFGNPFLEPEEGQSYNLSLGGRFGSVDWMVTGFRRTVENLISFETSDPAGGAYSPLIPDSVENHPDYSGEAYINAGEAKFDGYEVILNGEINSAWRWNFSYTDTDAVAGGATAQIQRIPESIAKAGVEWEPDGRWGVSASGLWVGNVYQNLAACNVPSCAVAVPALRANYGDYFVVDLAAHVFLDDSRKHKLTARLQNALDEDYSTTIQRATTDAGNGRFDTSRRGVPQTLHVRYTYAFGG